MDPALDKSELEKELHLLQQRVGELQKINNLYQHIFNKLPNGIQIFDSSGFSRMINDAQKELLGMPDLSEGIGIFNVLTDPFSVSHGVNKLYEKAYQGEQVSHVFEYNFDIVENQWETRKDKRYFSETIIPLRNEKGEVEYVMALLDDSTNLLMRENRLNLAEEKFSIAFNASPAAMIISGIDTGRILDANPAYQRLFGYDHKELIGNSAVNLKIYESQEIRNEIISEIKVRGKLVNHEVNLWSKSGIKRSCLFSAEIIEVPNETEKFLLTIIFDITDKKIAEKALQESEAKYRTLIEASNDAIFINENNRISYLNSAATKLFGANSPELLLGKSIFEVFHPDYHQIIQSRISNMLNSNIKVPLLEEKIIQLDGKVVDVEVSSAPFNHNNSTKLIVILRDIRERKRAEEEIHQNQINLKHQNEEYLAINEELHESNSRIQEMNEHLVNLVTRLEKSESEKTILLERLNEAQQISKLGSWEWNIQTGEVWWSDELYRIFDVDPNAYVPSVEGNAKFVHPEDTGAYHKAAFNCLETGEKLDFDLRITTPAGVIKYCKSTGQVFFTKDGKPQRFTGSFSDITNQKQLYNELLKAKEKAEESDRLKSAFLANMSHEIRTPMNAIIGFSEILLKPGITPDKQHKFATIVKERSYDLLRIVEDILDVSKIEVGQLVISESETEIAATMQEVYEYFFQKLKLIEKKAHLQLRLNLAQDVQSLKIETDVQRLKQLLYNLIDNAIKFTDEGGIEFGCRQNTVSELLFYVRDTGIGISEDKKSIIFDRFRQAEDLATSRKYGGSGLGLSIVKGILDLMHGRVWVDSTPGKGTTFNFTIPLKAISHMENEPYKSESVCIARNENYILVVEDDLANVEYLKVLLSDCGLKALFAQTGCDALKYIESEPSINLILMDVRLPDINGLDLTREILKKNPDIKVIAQTAYATAMDIKECMEAGCAGYVSKPINSGVLLKYVEKYL